jgi:hypothetical protein
MTKARLLSTVATALLLTVGVASAQTLKKDEAPTPAPAAQQKAPAEKVAPNMKAGEKNAETHKAPETVGQASDADKTRATDKSAMDKGADKAAEQSGVKSSSDAKTPDVKSSSDAKAPSDKSATDATVKPKSNESTAQGAAKSSTTGQGAAAGSAKLSTEQRGKITTIIKQQKVAPAKLDISISVGTRVPDSVHFYPLPVEVIVLYPEWRGYDYILVGDEILVVDPRTHEIVAILDA